MFILLNTNMLELKKLHHLVKVKIWFSYQINFSKAIQNAQSLMIASTARFPTVFGQLICHKEADVVSNKTELSNFQLMIFTSKDKCVQITCFFATECPTKLTTRCHLLRWKNTIKTSSFPRVTSASSTSKPINKPLTWNSIVHLSKTSLSMSNTPTDMIK